MPMNNTKVARRRRDSEASPRPRDSDCNSATIRKNKDGAASRKKLNAKRYQTSIANISEFRRAQAPLQRAIEFNEAVMASLSVGLYTVDTEGLVTTMNPAAEKLFGWSVKELRGKKMHDIIHYKHRDGSPFPAHECPGLQVLRTGKSLTNCEDVFIRRDGTFFDVIYSSSPIRKGNKITGVVVVFRDVTQQKQAEAAAMRFVALVQSSH